MLVAKADDCSSVTETHFVEENPFRFSSDLHMHSEAGTYPLLHTIYGNKILRKKIKLERRLKGEDAYHQA